MEISIFNKGKIRRVNDREKLVDTIISHWKYTASYPLELPEGKTRWLVFSQMLKEIQDSIF